MSRFRAAVVILLSSLASALAFAQASPGGGCEVSPAAAADLATLRTQDAGRSRAGNVSARLALARKHSADWMAQLELQALVVYSSLPDERRQFSAVYRGLTTNLLFAQLLEARLVGGQDLDAIIPKALTDAPDAPFILRVVLERFVPGLSDMPDIAARYVRVRRLCQIASGRSTGWKR